MIENCLKFKDNQQKGLGYDSVLPPFNHNYTGVLLTQEEIDQEPFIVLGKLAAQVTKSSAREIDTNIFTSHAHLSLSQGK